MLSLEQAVAHVQTLANHQIHKERVSERLWKLVHVLSPDSAHYDELSYLKNENTRQSADNERQRVEKRLNGFEVRGCRAWNAIVDSFGPSLSQNELLSIAQIISYHASLKLDREAKRRKEVLIKWFDENFATIQPYFQKIVLRDADGNILNAKQND